MRPTRQTPTLRGFSVNWKVDKRIADHGSHFVFISEEDDFSDMELWQLQNFDDPDEAEIIYLAALQDGLNAVLGEIGLYSLDIYKNPFVGRIAYKHSGFLTDLELERFDAGLPLDHATKTVEYEPYNSDQLATSHKYDDYL
jgi:hypothetical protein